MKKKKLDRYFREQKLMGLGMVIISLLSFFIGEDGTAGLVFLSFGLLMMFSKRELIYGSSKKRK